MSTKERLIWICDGLTIAAVAVLALMGTVGLGDISLAVCITAMATTLHFTTFRTPIRVIYHSAPVPDSNGELITPKPITLTTDARDLSLAQRWLRRRLGLPR
jgi:hypothetical protein